MDFGDVLVDALAFNPLSAERGEYKEIAIAVLNLRAIKVDPEIDAGVRAYLSASAVSVENKRCDGSEEKRSENNSVMLVGGSS